MNKTTNVGMKANDSLPPNNHGSHEAHLLLQLHIPQETLEGALCRIKGIEMLVDR